MGHLPLSWSKLGEGAKPPNKPASASPHPDQPPSTVEVLPLS